MGESSLLQRTSRRLRERVTEASDSWVRRPLRRLRNSGRSYRPIFVAGAMGSGTSLLAVAVGSRFETAGVAYESARDVSLDSFLHLRALSDYANVAEYAEALRPSPSWSMASAQAALQHCYRAVATGGSEFVVDKGPNANLVRAEFLASCFPAAPFLLVFRDPVVNLEGFRRKWPTFGNDSLEASIRFYKEIHERFLAAVPALGDRLIAVDYDRLVERFDQTLDEIGDRLGLRPAQTRRALKRRENSPGKGLRNVRDNRIHLVKDASQKAYERLAPNVVEEIRAALAPIHERLKEVASPCA